jgi:hypothetical protein
VRTVACESRRTPWTDAAQIEQFDRDGSCLPDLFERNEVAVLRREVARLSQVQARRSCASTPAACAPSSASTRTTAPTRSQPFRALVRTPRLLRPVQQVLKDDAVYVYHTKINTKPAIEGTVWQWHQDYGSWMRDGCARPDMATFNVMMTDTTEMGGALYLIPGSHKLGRIEPVYGRIDLVQVLGDAQAAHDRDPEELARAGGRHRPRRHLRCCSIATCCTPRATISRPTTAGTSTSRATPSPTSRSSAQPAARLGGVAQLERAADRGRRRAF